MKLPRLPKRKPDSHKGDYGTVLVVAGSRGMMGAAVLTSQAALRSGAGLSALVIPRSLVDVVAAMQVCAVVRGVADTGAGTLAAEAAEEILRMDGDVLAVGPGLGLEPRTVQAVREIVGAERRPLVLDADALNAFSDDAQPLESPGGTRILTPHPGEMARLLHRSAAQVQADRIGAAREAANRFHAICVLKGHGTVVTDGAKTAVNETGNPGMATGGSGDVLTGVIAALVAQGLSPWDAARLGVHVHGLAGDLWIEEHAQVSLIATDLLETLPDAFLEVEE